MKEPKTEAAKPDIDLRLATIRRDCLSLAVECYKSNNDDSMDVLGTAAKMFKFVIGEENKQEWK